MNKKINIKKNKFFKSISLLTVFTFIAQPLAFAQSYAPTQNYQQAQREPASIRLPAEELQGPQNPVDITELSNTYIYYQIAVDENEVLDDDIYNETNHEFSSTILKKDDKKFFSKGKVKAEIGFTKWVPFAKFQKDGPYTPYIWAPSIGAFAITSITDLALQDSALGTAASTLAIANLAIPVLTIGLPLLAVGILAITTGGNIKLTRTLPVKTELYGNYWGEGKFNGSLVFKGRKKCAPVSIQLTGTQNSYGSYDLHITNVKGLEDKVFGTYSDFGRTKSITLIEDLNLNSSGRRGTSCSWHFNKTTALTF